MKNAPNHVFGDHRRCKETYCQDKAETKDVNVIEKLDPEFSVEIYKLMDRLVRKADSLVMNSTTNAAERYRKSYNYDIYEHGCISLINNN